MQLCAYALPLTRACVENQNPYAKSMITSRKFGTLPSGEIITAFDLESEAGFRATILTYGATLQSLTFPNGQDVVLGFDNLEGYLGKHPYFSSAVGRVASRIGGARFQIDGIEYALSKNEGENNLHSGPEGFERAIWESEIHDQTLILRHTSPDGHQGFPGELLTELRFNFQGHRLSLNIQAAIDKACPVNITYHPYFNLTNQGATPCTDHDLQIYADFHTPKDSENIPTGEILPTSPDSSFDYKSPQTIKEKDTLNENFILKAIGAENRDMVKMAQIRSRTTGHKVIICSTQMCLQLYSGSHIPRLKGKAGVTYGSNHGVALEPQSFPDAVNQINFPDNILRPGEIYNHTISYTFRPGEVQA